MGHALHLTLWVCRDLSPVEVWMPGEGEAGGPGGSAGPTREPPQAGELQVPSGKSDYPLQEKGKLLARRLVNSRGTRACRPRCRSVHRWHRCTCGWVWGTPGSRGPPWLLSLPCPLEAEGRAFSLGEAAVRRSHALLSLLPPQLSHTGLKAHVAPSCAPR